jgi:hypothetical protein
MKPRRVRCSYGKCRCSVRWFWIEQGAPEADGWGLLEDVGAVPRDDLWLCPLHNLLVRHFVVVEEKGAPGKSP